MDRSYRARKLKSMKKHKSSRLTPSNNHLILDLLTASMGILACSNHFWLSLPSLEYCMNHFLSVTLPHMRSTFLHPACLFVVVNAIVVFLIGESRLRASPSPSSPADDLYAEYVDRIGRGKKGFKVCDAVSKKENNERDSKEEFINEDRGVEEVEEEGTKLSAEYVDPVGRGKKGFKASDAVPEKENNQERDSKEEFASEDGGVEEVGEEGTRKLLEKGKDKEEELPAEELNRRVEAFIARVNERRWLEARSVICADA